MNKKTIYTRFCKKHKGYYQTTAKYGSVCEDCDGRYNENKIKDGKKI